jgi:hypothetical protein
MLRFKVLVLSVTAALVLGATSPVAAPEGKGFSSPQAAANALVAAAKANDVNAIVQILGPSSLEIVSTRDTVGDRNMRRRFANLASEKIRIVARSGHANECTLLAGKDEWPMPIPIVRVGGKWYFDTARGKQEILNRRIGSNELDAIEVCRGYVEAQNNYAENNQTEDGVPYYAQKIISSLGKHDGLYWAGEDNSPMEKLIATAFAEGYTQRGQPYHGYYFKVLKAQGPNGSGGEMSYLTGDKMTKGYALIAWPANYGSTGVMTFLVDKTGIVYEKDLGRRTAAIASRCSAYHPDQTWKPVSKN